MSYSVTKGKSLKAHDQITQIADVGTVTSKHNILVVIYVKWIFLVCVKSKIQPRLGFAAPPPLQIKLKKHYWEKI